MITENNSEKMESGRYIVWSSIPVLNLLSEHIMQNPEKYALIKRLETPLGQNTGHIVIRTTPNTARQLQELLEGIGSIELDELLNPPRPPIISP